jgi:hypothetical protein
MKNYEPQSHYMYMAIKQEVLKRTNQPTFHRFMEKVRIGRIVYKDMTSYKIIEFISVCPNIT